jgi:hypothetical protein
MQFSRIRTVATSLFLAALSLALTVASVLADDAPNPWP